MIELLSDSIYGCFEEICKAYPARKAIIYLGREYTFAELREMVLRLASSLVKIGIKEGDRAMLYLYNVPQTIISLLALQRIGARSVPVAPVYGSYDLKYLANDSGAETIFCIDSNFNYVNEILPETSVTRVIITNMVDLIPLWKRWIAKGFDRVPRGKFPSGKGMYSFVKLLKEGK
ncbi:MAG: AMP-dependent synthetase, partial [Deltaproteobacteria bacterium]